MRGWKASLTAGVILFASVATANDTADAVTAPAPAARANPTKVVSVPDNLNILPYSAQYVLQRSGIKVATGDFSLRREGDSYLYESHSKSAGIVSLFRDDDIVELTRWQLANHGVRPLQYRFAHTGIDDERHVTIDFDWSAGEVTNTVNGDAWQMAVPTGTLDKLSVQLALSVALRQGQRGPFQFPVADGGKLKTYHFEVVGEEEVETPAGRFKAIRVLRKKDKRQTTLWFAPKLDWMPIRLDQPKKKMSMRLVSLKQAPAKP
jgi:hypothetical protein